MPHRKLALSSERAEPPEARWRLEVLRRWQLARRRGLSSQQAAEVVGVPRSTLYRWQKRLQQDGAAGLADQSRRPHRLRSSWLLTPELLRLLRTMRERLPAYGKAKLHALMRRPELLRRGPQPLRKLSERIEALQALPSESTIGRALSLLQRRGQLPFIERRRYARRGARKRTERRRWARRSTAAVRLQALQVDGGSEFKAHFEQACEQLQLPLFVLPARSPKLNGKVERTHGSRRYEVCAAHHWPWPLAPLRARLREQQHIYNFVRLHQADRLSLWPVRIARG